MKYRVDELVYLNDYIINEQMRRRKQEDNVTKKSLSHSKRQVSIEFVSSSI